MSRKDYVKFAEMLRGLPDGMSHTRHVVYWTDVRDRIADIFAVDNPRFDRERFEKACKGEK